VLARVVRQAKMLGVFIVILLKLNNIVIAFISFFLQLISTAVMIRKATYQHIMVEYLFSVGTFSGFVSSIDLLISVLLNTPYCFIGEAAVVIFFLLALIEKYPLAILFELKYTLVLNNNTSQRN